MADKLTPKQERFIQEYLIDLNATAAARRAGYSEKTAEQMGYQLLQKSSVSAKIQTAIEERAKRTNITQDHVLEELAEIAFADAHDHSDSNLKFGNKLKALELLGKHLGMFDGKGSKQNYPANNLLQAILTIEELDTSNLPEVE